MNCPVYIPIRKTLNNRGGIYCLPTDKTSENVTAEFLYSSVTILWLIKHFNQEISLFSLTNGLSEIILKPLNSMAGVTNDANLRPGVV
jgi:hypothetical protein